jgi:hypothetical protein
MAMKDRTGWEAARELVTLSIPLALHRFDPDDPEVMAALDTFDEAAHEIAAGQDTVGVIRELAFTVGFALDLLAEATGAEDLYAAWREVVARMLAAEAADREGG